MPKYRLKISKTGHLKFISHLDWHKLIYTSIRKSGMKLNFSQGFNPTPKISIGAALPLFIEGKNEYIDIELCEEIAENIIREKLNGILPETSRISRVVKLSKGSDTIEKNICYAVYSAQNQKLSTNEKIYVETIAKEFLLKENVVIAKTSKKGVKEINIRPLVYAVSFDREKNILEFTLGSLRADIFLKALTPKIDWKITRERLLDFNFKELI